MKPGIMSGGFLLAVFLWIMTSPLWADNYKLSAFTDFGNQVDHQMKAATADYDFCQNALEGAQAASSTPENSAYSAQVQPLADFKKSLDALSAQAVSLVQTLDQIKALYGSDSLIGDTDSRWKALQTLKDAFQKQANDLQSRGGTFNSAKNNFERSTANAGIGAEKASDILDPLQEKIRKKKIKLPLFREMVRRVKKLHLEGQEVGMATRMEERLAKFETGLEQSENLFAALQKSCGGKEILYSGPGVPEILPPALLSETLDKMGGWYKESKSDWEKIRPEDQEDIDFKGDS